MHEHSVCQALLKKAERVAHAHQAKRIKSITVDIGPLAGIVIEELDHAFPHNCEGTLAEGAQLIIQQTPIEIKCLDCNINSKASTQNQDCPQCNSPNTQLISGDQMRIIDIELITQ